MNGRSRVRKVLSVLAGALVLLAAVPSVPAAAAGPALVPRPSDILALDGAASDFFGCSVSVWGDTALVGAYGDDSSKGSAYVFEHVGDAWSFRQKLVAPDGAASDRFGYSVALSGDTALVGAHGDDGYLGSAYVFVRTGSTWMHQQKLLASDGAAGDDFGYSVALSGDTALVGAHGDDGYLGSAYVFVRTGSTWTYRQKLLASDGAAGDGFGYSVALSGETALVGAWGDDTTRGSAYMFTGSGSAWSQRAKLLASDRDVGDRLGCSVALSGDTALVGAEGDDSYTGSAYVFTGSGSAWSQRAKLLASDGAANHSFGHSVALSGGSAVIGRPWDDEKGSGSGSAYLFGGSGSSWEQRVKLLAQDGLANDAFGVSVALSGGNAVVGAWNDDTVTGSDVGSAWVFRFGSAVTPGVARVAGASRYVTAEAASLRGFPIGAPAVVVATGMNWPDALGGSALAGAAHGPLLLTRKDVLPGEVVSEIVRTGAVRAYVLGSPAAVSTGVEEALVSILGRANVVRLGGANRYETARKVADETIRLLGSFYSGLAFVATGANYPDATAASPLAAALGVPVLLANPATGAVSLPPTVTRATVLGSEAAVPRRVFATLEGALGPGKVARIGGANRYDTAARIAGFGVSSGLYWNGCGLATGTNFPDALAAGPMLAAHQGVLLLTRPDRLPSETAAALSANAAAIDAIFIFGDHNAVSLAVENAARAAAGL